MAVLPSRVETDNKQELLDDSSSRNLFDDSPEVQLYNKVSPNRKQKKQKTKKKSRL